MLWTDEQARALSHSHNKNGAAIVSAAAGSGKTAVLVERLVSIISDERLNVPANSLVVVTFTNKAANELKMRLNKALKALIKTNNSEYLKTQLILLKEARISTINSFCINILRDNINALDVLPGFSILSEEEAGILAQKAIDIALDKYFDNISQDKSNVLFNTFIDTNDERLAKYILDFNSFLSNIPNKDKWIDKQRKLYDDEIISYDFYFNIIKSVVFDKSLVIQKTIEKAYELANNLPNDMPAKDKIAGIIQSDLNAILDLKHNSFKENNAELFFALNTLSFGRFPSITKKTLQDNPEFLELKDNIKGLRDKYLKKAKALTNLNFPMDFYKDDLSFQKSVTEIIFEIYKVFNQEFLTLKLDKNAIDFSDAEQLCYQILSDNGKPSKAAMEISKDISMIIVDEFQDSNDLQYEIFRLISNNERNLFFVGDVKQSIYGFRGANPNVFISLCERKDYTLLPLNKNFRSRNVIVNSVNSVFESIMTKKTGGANYQDSRLVYGADYEVEKDTPTELYIFNSEFSEALDEDEIEELSNIENQASFVSAKINEMISSGFLVKDKNGYRRARPSDFCVLLRGVKNSAKHFVDYLREYGIVANSSGIKNYLGLFEVNLIIDYLTIIDNPLKNIELLSILMSPLYLFNTQELSAIRVGAIGIDVLKLEKIVDMRKFYESFKKSSLYSCVLKCAKPFTADELENDEFYKKCFSESDIEKLKELFNEDKEAFRLQADDRCLRFIADFRELRSFMSANSVERLIRKIYDNTNFINAISLYENNTQKVANLRKLLAYASDFERNTNSGLSDFLRFIENLKNNNQDLTQANIGSSAEDAVQVMTIHASKGLEFPVVFICDLQKQFNSEYLKEDLIYDINFGIGLRYIDNERLIKYDTLTHTAIKEIIMAKNISEEMRLLYVAMTRAKEKLIMTACVKGGYEKFLENVNSAYEIDISRVKNYLEWITYTIGEKVDYIDKDNIPSEFLIKDIPMIIKPAEYLSTDFSAEIETNIGQDADVNSIDIIKNIEQNFEFQYPFEEDTRTPEKYTATQLAKLELEKNNASAAESFFYFRNPNYIDKKELTGKFYGDTYHKLMEIIPFDKIIVSSEERISQFIRDSISAGRLTQIEADIINPFKILKFFNTNLGKRVLDSADVNKEYPIFAHIMDIEKADIKNADDIPIVQGIADLFFYEGDEIVLVDYKTDSISDLNSLVKLYKKQITTYKMALEKMFLKKVKACYLYSFNKDKEIEVI